MFVCFFVCLSHCHISYLVVLQMTLNFLGQTKISVHYYEFLLISLWFRAYFALVFTERYHCYKGKKIILYSFWKGGGGVFGTELKQKKHFLFSIFCLGQCFVNFDYFFHFYNYSPSPPFLILGCKYN